MEGTILGNRYQLIEQIGGGGMAIVYKAKCRLLNRYVAVKILRPEFTSDKEFLERFKVESQAAASLSHPNVVSIYDVGNENDINYIVMEYVDGVTLKEYIHENGPLPWRKAVNIAIQICSALEHAHKNHIVHRDIKPHNIIITNEMVAKVTDFGIARAVSSSTLTMTGNAIGSVHYFSPEQARGGYTDEKSDIYSLGIVLYEMLTGRVPFDGDSPVSIALKHLEDEIPPPNQVDLNIPASVNDIVLKAAKKNLMNRYQSASEMLDDLYSALKTPNGDFVKVNDENIDEQPTQRIIIPEELIKQKDSGNGKEKHKGVDAKVSKGDRATVIAALATSLIIILLISGGIAYYFSSKIFTKTEVLKAPNIVGKTVAYAEELAKQSNITIKETERRYDDTIPKDAIISQDPSADMDMKTGGEIQVVVSDGQELANIPKLDGLSYREAQNEVQKSGLLFKAIYQPNAEIPQNYVISQTPAANTPIAKNSEVQVYISDGPQNVKIKVPNLIGLSEEDALKIIRDSNLVLGKVTYIKSSTQSNNLVLNQSIKADTEVSNLSKINISVNKYVDSTTTKRTATSTQYITIDVRNKGTNPTFMVRVEVDGEAGKKIVHNATHSRQEGQIVVPVEGIGESIVRVYIDDKMDSEMVVNFGGGGQQ